MRWSSKPTEAPTRAPDGRTGRVLSIRLTDVQRETLRRAAEIDHDRRGGWRSYYGGGPAVGPFIVRAAMEKAAQLLQQGTTAADGKPGTTALEAGSTRGRKRRR